MPMSATDASLRSPSLSAYACPAFTFPAGHKAWDNLSTPLRPLFDSFYYELPGPRIHRRLVTFVRAAVASFFRASSCAATSFWYLQVQEGGTQGACLRTPKAQRCHDLSLSQKGLCRVNNLSRAAGAPFRYVTVPQLIESDHASASRENIKSSRHPSASGRQPSLTWRAHC